MRTHFTTHDGMMQRMLNVVTPCCDKPISLRQIISARQAERRQLSHLLHDRIGSTLAAYVLQLGRVRTLLTQDTEQATQLIAVVEDGIAGTLAELRRVVADLNPLAVEQLSLQGALENFCGQYQSAFVVELDIANELPPTSPAVEVAVYYIIEAALASIAEATYCVIKLWADRPKNHLHLTIIDDRTAANGYPESSLDTMREWAVQLDGVFEIGRNNPPNTQIDVCIPI